MDLENLISQLAEKIEDQVDKEIFLETIEELGEEVTVDDVLTLFENIGDVNNELDSQSASKALKAFGLEGKEGEGASPLHKKMNNGPKEKQEGSHNSEKKSPVEDDKEEVSLAPYAKKLNAAASAKVKALKPNDKAIPEGYDEEEGCEDEKKEKKAAKKLIKVAKLEKKKMKESFDFSSDINALFEGTELSEEFKEKALLIFESSVSQKINEHIDHLYEEVDAYFEEVEGAVAEIITEEVELFKEEALEQIDSYLDYIVEEFLEENAVELESGIKVEIAESLLEGFKTLLQEHNIDVSDEKIDLVDEVIAENEEIVESYNKEVERNIELNREVKDLKKERLIKELSEDLTAVEAEKFAKLIEGIEYSDDESFIKKVNILAEAYSPSEKPTVKTLSEEYYEEEDTNKVEISSDVQGVLKSLDRFGK